MAIITVNTDLLPGPFFINTPKAGGVARGYRFQLPVTVQADIGSSIRICELPQNAVVCQRDSYVRVLSATTSLTLALGHEAYTKPDKTIVPANTAALGAATSVAAGTYVQFSDFASAPLDFVCDADLVVTALVGGANLTVGKVLDGLIWIVANF